EVHDGVNAGQQTVEQVGIADVAVHERVPRRPGNRLEVGEVSGVGEGVEYDDFCALQTGVGVFDHATDEVGPDEPGPSGNKKFHPAILMHRVIGDTEHR